MKTTNKILFVALIILMSPGFIITYKAGESKGFKDGYKRSTESILTHLCYDNIEVTKHLYWYYDCECISDTLTIENYLWLRPENKRDNTTIKINGKIYHIHEFDLHSWKDSIQVISRNLKPFYIQPPF